MYREQPRTKEGQGGEDFNYVAGFRWVELIPSVGRLVSLIFPFVCKVNMYLVLKSKIKVHVRLC